jgi:hypothetical protein
MSTVLTFATRSAMSANTRGRDRHPSFPEREAPRSSQACTNPPKKSEVSVLREPSANVNGRWDMRIEFIQCAADHRIAFEQQAGRLNGTCFGEDVHRDLAGTTSGSTVKFRPRQQYEGTVLD